MNTEKSRKLFGEAKKILLGGVSSPVRAYLLQENAFSRDLSPTVTIQKTNFYHLHIRRMI
jgi:hypothetical protein